MKNYLLVFAVLCATFTIHGQDYYYKDLGPFDSSIPSPEAFLGYKIGDYHTRHDRIVSYFEALDAASDKATLTEYGKTHELRRLVILQISSEENLINIQNHRQKHLQLVDPSTSVDIKNLAGLPIFVNLGYNVHGNEPSSSEAAMLSAYVLIASLHPEVVRYRQNALIFIDPVINPDGRDRHTQWANSYRAEILSSDPLDAEHNEMWPRGRTNHYWFDLNRDWLLAVHPESQGKLAWYHDWYPNVVTDFHEMGSNSTYFFEPMKDNASQNPIMPKENYTTLNETFAKYYRKSLDQLGSLYFTKEVFDGTYPGYGSSYPDLQGGLGILFEQASSRGHIQETSMGEITFPFTIRNQFVNSIATVEAAVDNREILHSYQKDFFKSAINNAKNDRVKSYVIGENSDRNRLSAFVNLLLNHKIQVYELTKEVHIGDVDFNPGTSYVIPTEQAQYRMVQTMFETYSEYRDSVFYDASAWSLANAYNIQYAPSLQNIQLGKLVTRNDILSNPSNVPRSEYSYLIRWQDYNAPGLLFQLQARGIKVMASQKPFKINTSEGLQEFSYGTLVIPVQHQSIGNDSLFQLITEVAQKWNIQVFSAPSGYSNQGIDLGSSQVSALETPKVMMLIGGGINSYEAGFIWHLFDQRVNMPISKIRIDMFGRANLSKYNTLVLASGNYSELDSIDIRKIKQWVSEGNTLITIGSASEWAIKKKLVNESLVKKKEVKKDTSEIKRLPYDGARERRGKDEVGGAIFMTDLDITHPIGYGYQRNKLPVYRNNSVWLEPSKNEFSNVAIYTREPHIDGFISKNVLEDFLKKSASIVVSRIGGGRAVLFAEDPNFRGVWYGTNKLFLNAIFFGDLIRVP